MKNHFIISYFGNKREEVEEIYKNLDLTNINIKTIIEPYCGSSAMSYYISSLNPKKFNYILNDNDKNIVMLYEIMKDEKKTLIFNNKINGLIDSFNKFSNDRIKQKEYYETLKKIDDIYHYFFLHKYYSIRPNIYPLTRKKAKLDHFDLTQYPIYNFINTENVTINNEEGVVIFEKYKNNDTCLILLDPPYLCSHNDCYDKYNGNIYEYLYNNDINIMKSKIVLILEKTWIILLLFNNNKILEYNKMYQSKNKKKTKHLIITQL